MKRYNREYRKSHQDKIRDYKKQWEKQHSFQLRMLVIEHYGGVCACCGETEMMFLCIDHINGGGNAQRLETGWGTNFYQWLVDHNYPDGYRILCHNCNMSYGIYGMCPHNK